MPPRIVGPAVPLVTTTSARASLSCERRRLCGGGGRQRNGRATSVGRRATATRDSSARASVRVVGAETPATDDQRQSRRLQACSRLTREAHAWSSVFSAERDEQAGADRVSLQRALQRKAGYVALRSALAPIRLRSTEPKVSGSNTDGRVSRGGGWRPRRGCRRRRGSRPEAGRRGRRPGPGGRRDRSRRAGRLRRHRHAPGR